MRWIIFLLPMMCFAKIYDCFLFFNEFEVLKIRMEELYDVVDHFVLVEAKQSFRGLEKPLYFEENQHLFAPYADKIIHVVINEPLESDSPWPREEWQRNQIMRGLTHCQPDDIIIVADCDEIPKARCFDEIITLLNSRKPNTKQKYRFIGCDADFYRWFLNRKDPNRWHGFPCFTKYKYLKKSSPQAIRHTPKDAIVTHSAWHFSNIGTLDTYIEKIDHFSHYRECINSSRDAEEIYRSVCELFDLVELDDSFPVYILENKEYFFDNNLLDRPGGYYQ